MKQSKLLLIAALSAVAWCSASQAQTVLYGVEYYGSSTGTTPSESNRNAYRSSPADIGYSVNQYRDYNGNWRERADPVVVERRGSTTYVYPETAQLGSRSPTVIYSTPGVDVYMDLDRTWDSRLDSRY